MNFKGIRLLREFGLPGPPKEVSLEYQQILKQGLENLVDLEDLYQGSVTGSTILVFDKNEKVNQNQLFEKNVRKYNVSRNDLESELSLLIPKILKKDSFLSVSDLVVMLHQSYYSNDKDLDVSHAIKYSGKVSLNLDWSNSGFIYLDVVDSLRKANTDFQPDLSVEIPVKFGHLIFRERKTDKDIFNEEKDSESFEFPEKYLLKLSLNVLNLNKKIKEYSKINVNPIMDYEFFESGELFYHDLQTNNPIGDFLESYLLEF